ncbi:MAG: hypothetical protein KGL39_47615 [Patescibacteria group bacterium]|nr:hypothetical protein [Patescibacteria group bacterium]
MNLEELQRITRSSVELSKNAKGDYQWVIKAYFEDGQEDDALDRLKHIDDELRKQYAPESLSK